MVGAEVGAVDGGVGGPVKANAARERIGEVWGFGVPSALKVGDVGDSDGGLEAA